MADLDAFLQEIQTLEANPEAALKAAESEAKAAAASGGTAAAKKNGDTASSSDAGASKKKADDSTGASNPRPSKKARTGKATLFKPAVLRLTVKGGTAAGDEVVGEGGGRGYGAYGQPGIGPNMGMGVGMGVGMGAGPAVRNYSSQPPASSDPQAQFASQQSAYAYNPDAYARAKRATAKIEAARSSKPMSAAARTMAMLNGGAAKKKKSQFVRSAAGEVWQDKTLAEWPENDFRLFIGDIGNECSDEVLAQAFRRYKSFAKAKIVRDSVSQKTKGYGFVSMLDPHDAAAAIREMNGACTGADSSAHALLGQRMIALARLPYAWSLTSCLLLLQASTLATALSKSGRAHGISVICTTYADACTVAAARCSLFSCRAMLPSTRARHSESSTSRCKRSSGSCVLCSRSSCVQPTRQPAFIASS